MEEAVKMLETVITGLVKDMQRNDIKCLAESHRSRVMGALRCYAAFSSCNSALFFKSALDAVSADMVDQEKWRA